MVLAVDAVWPIVFVAVTVSVVTSALPAFRLSPDNCDGDSVQLPSAFFVPADRFASAGTPVIFRETVSRASNGVSVIPRTTVLPAFTVSEAGVVSVGATGVTDSETVFDTELLVKGSVVVIVSVADVTPPPFNARPASCPCVNVALPFVTAIAPAASLSVTPGGIPDIVTDRFAPVFTNVKSLAVSLDRRTPSRTTISPASPVITVSAPTCLAATITAAKFANCDVAN